jgi:hypothetical protein
MVKISEEAKKALADPKIAEAVIQEIRNCIK